uniref:Uncharacterized protein n=1 Tax=Molossus molossus TaxID=27622 RepID=A0A7J8B6V2_MOLMO|nr:hypothetical protein HJG59_010908 [Molossus molossus]
MSLKACAQGWKLKPRKAGLSFGGGAADTHPVLLLVSGRCNRQFHWLKKQRCCWGSNVFFLGHRVLAAKGLAQNRSWALRWHTDLISVPGRWEPRVTSPPGDLNQPSPKNKVAHLFLAHILRLKGLDHGQMWL